MHILQLAREAEMQQEQEKYVPTEKAQIVVVYRQPQSNSICRFNSVKKAEKEFKAFTKAWADPKGLYHVIEHDMFTSVFDVFQIASIHFVDHSKHEKFKPVRYNP